MQQMIFIVDLVACSKICNKNHLLHLVGILFPHIYRQSSLRGWAKNLFLLGTV